MTKLPNGEYRTKSGSTMRIYGSRSERRDIVFDWLEEGACIECDVDSMPEQDHEGRWFLFWGCNDCGGGSAEIFPEAQMDLEDAIAQVDEK